jgi:ABC-type sugar transport system ATPase subunit
MSMLELERVSKRYGRGALERMALCNVSLEIEPGELVAVWGRRGSGRSTLLRLAAGVETPDDGVVRFEGRDLNGRQGQLGRTAIRYCRREFRAAEGQLVIDRLTTGQLSRGISAPQARSRAHAALERVAASYCAMFRPGELENTEVVRVAIARSLVHDPRLLVIDEPTVGVDPNDRDQILSLLRALTGDGTAVLMSVGETTCLSGSDRALSLGEAELHGRLTALDLAPVVPIRDVAGWTASG